MPLRVGLGLSDWEGGVLALVLHSELRVPCLQGLALLRTLRAAECVVVVRASRGPAVATVALRPLAPCFLLLAPATVALKPCPHRSPT